jgi:hypothetical protein
MKQQITAPDLQKRIPPKGMFRLLGVDTFEGPFAEFIAGNFPTEDEALAAGTKFKAGHDMMKYYVYNDKGDFVAEAE